MQREGLTREQLCPSFVPGGIGGDHLRSARSQRFALRQNGRDEHGAGMSVERDIVIVEHVSRNTIDQSGILDIAPRAGGNERGKRGSVVTRQLAIDQRNDALACACDHHAETIGEAGLGDGLGFQGYVAESKRGNKSSQFSG